MERSIQEHGQHFLDRLFTLEEQAYCSRYKRSARHYAGRFAAKEAVVKALGTGFGEAVSWLDMEIMNDERGKPYVKISSKLEERFNHPVFLISISHCEEYATAFAVWM